MGGGGSDMGLVHGMGHGVTQKMTKMGSEVVRNRVKLDDFWMIFDFNKFPPRGS